MGAVSSAPKCEKETMTQVTTAIFEQGTLRPVKPLVGVAEHALVRVTVESLSALSKEEKLEMLRAVPFAEELADAIETGRKTAWRVEEF